MKKIYTLIFVSLVFLGTKINATIVDISVANFTFTPMTVTAQCNDTIRWTWASGTHTVTSTTIPICASPWTTNMSSTSTFMITVPCAGMYNYQCNIHAPNMVGFINVTCPSGITEPVKNTSILLYPNPCMEKVSVKYENADAVSVFNLVGEKMMDVKLSGNSGTTELNVAELSSGVYFVAIMKEGIIVETKKITKQ